MRDSAAVRKGCEGSGWGREGSGVGTGAGWGGVGWGREGSGVGKARHGTAPVDATEGTIHPLSVSYPVITKVSDRIYRNVCGRVAVAVAVAVVVVDA